MLVQAKRAQALSQQVKNSTGTDGLSETIDEDEAQCVLGASLGAIAFVVRPRIPVPSYHL